MVDSIFDVESQPAEPIESAPETPFEPEAIEPARDPASEPVREEPGRSLLEFLRPSGRSARRQERLIDSLNEVADAISSTKSIPEILATVVDESKRLLDTDKAVLCLFNDSGSELTIDDRAVFVRGRRDQYPENWWRERISEVARSAVDQRSPITSTVDGTLIMTVPVKTKGRAIGVLTVMNPGSRRFSQDQVALLAILGAFAGSAIENSRLNAQSHYALLSDERSRIAKEMHDGLSQRLFSVSLELDVCRKRVVAHPDEVERRLGHMQAVLVRSLGELRRYIYDLRPISLSTLGLIGAIQQRAVEIGEARGLSVRVYTEGRERSLPPGVEACLYRVAQEAVSNIAKHAKAQRAVIVIEYGTSDVRFVVEDDGAGFDVPSALAKCEHDECIGLRSMRERVESQGGYFSIASGDRGSTIEAVIPC
jgi:signal transduction histidine kinase